MLFKPFFDVCDVTVMRKCRVRISARVCREIGKDARETLTQLQYSYISYSPAKTLTQLQYSYISYSQDRHLNGDKPLCLFP